MMKSLTTALASVLLGAWAPATHAQTIRHSTTTQTEELQALYRGITHMDVFVNSAMHVQGNPASHVSLQIYRVDDMLMIRQAINANLPKNERQAYEYVMANEGRIREQYTERLLHAAQGLTLARDYQIQKIPAVVFNQQYVLYGITDMAVAVKTFHDSMRNLPPQGVLQ